MTDKQLIERFQAGDSSALGVLYNRYKRMLTMYIYSWGYTDAEDILHETFIQILKYPHDYTGEFTVRSWLIITAKQRIHTRWNYQNCQKRKGTPISIDEERDIPIQIASDSQNPEQVTGVKMELETAQKKVDNLSPKLKQALTMRCYDGYEYEEIAQILNINLNTVKSRIHRARQAL